jgi:hypothetical protein
MRQCQPLITQCGMAGCRMLEPFRERVKKNWWRFAVTVATLVMGTFAWYEPTVAVLAVVPALVWCWVHERADRKGTVAGVILLALTAWILLPRDLGFSGPLVPSIFEVCLLLPIFVVVIYLTSTRYERSRGCLPALGLSAFVLAGLLTAGWTVVLYSEGDTGDEGVWPGPSGLQVVEGEREGGSGGMNRQLIATGDRAPERMRDYLSSRGFSPQGNGRTSVCRANGVLLTYKVCAAVVDISPTTAQVTWWI